LTREKETVCLLHFTIKNSLSRFNALLSQQSSCTTNKLFLQAGNEFQKNCRLTDFQTLQIITIMINSLKDNSNMNRLMSFVITSKLTTTRHGALTIKLAKDIINNDEKP